MKYHPLTEAIESAFRKDNFYQFSVDELEDINKIITATVKRQSQWLKNQAYDGVITPKMIDEAFGLVNDRTLESKFQEFMITNSISMNGWEKTKKELAEIARQHYIDHPEELK